MFTISDKLVSVVCIAAVLTFTGMSCAYHVTDFPFKSTRSRGQNLWPWSVHCQSILLNWGLECVCVSVFCIKNTRNHATLRSAADVSRFCVSSFKVTTKLASLLYCLHFITCSTICQHSKASNSVFLFYAGKRESIYTAAPERLHHCQKPFLAI